MFGGVLSSHFPCSHEILFSGKIEKRGKIKMFCMIFCYGNTKGCILVTFILFSFGRNGRIFSILRQFIIFKSYTNKDSLIIVDSREDFDFVYMQSVL